MLTSEVVLLDLTDRIYAAAEDARLLPSFLECLTREMRARLAALVFEDLRSREASVDAGFRFEGPIWLDHAEGSPAQLIIISLTDRNESTPRVESQ